MRKFYYYPEKMKIHKNFVEIRGEVYKTIEKILRKFKRKN